MWLKALNSEAFKYIGIDIDTVWAQMTDWGSAYQSDAWAFVAVECWKSRFWVTVVLLSQIPLFSHSYTVTCTKYTSN